MSLQPNFTEVSSQLELTAAPHSNRDTSGSNPCEERLLPASTPATHPSSSPTSIPPPARPTAKRRPAIPRRSARPAQLLLSPALLNTARPRAPTHRSIPRLLSAGSRPAAHRPPWVAPCPQADDASPPPARCAQLSRPALRRHVRHTGQQRGAGGSSAGRGRSELLATKPGASRSPPPAPLPRAAALAPRGNHDFFPLCAAPEYAPRRHRTRMDPKLFSPRPSARGSVTERPSVPPPSPSASPRGLRRLPDSGAPGGPPPEPPPRPAPRTRRRRARLGPAHLGTQLGAERSISHVAKRFMGTGTGPGPATAIAAAAAAAVAPPPTAGGPAAGPEPNAPTVAAAAIPLPPVALGPTPQRRPPPRRAPAERGGTRRPPSANRRAAGRRRAGPRPIGARPEGRGLAAGVGESERPGEGASAGVGQSERRGGRPRRAAANRNEKGLGAWGGLGQWQRRCRRGAWPRAL